jgi:hypothetical protein
MKTQTRSAAVTIFTVTCIALLLFACDDVSSGEPSSAALWTGSITCGGSAAGIEYPDQSTTIEVDVEQTPQRLFLHGVQLGIPTLSCMSVSLSATPDSNDNYFFVPTSCTATSGENVMLSTLSPARFIDNRLDFAVSLDRADRDSDYAECTATLTSP